jgi:DNA-binding NarL/FixJ family response regulator
MFVPPNGIRRLVVGGSVTERAELLEQVRSALPRHLVIDTASVDGTLEELLALAVEADPGLRSVTLVLPHCDSRRDGGCTLTPRETEVLTLVGQGFTNVRIAHLLWVTPDTVKFHVRNACHKLNAHGRLEAFRIARSRGLLGTRPPRR